MVGPSCSTIIQNILGICESLKQKKVLWEVRRLVWSCFYFAVLTVNGCFWHVTIHYFFNKIKKKKKDHK